MHSLSPLFRPHVIAVLGASDRYGSTGRTVFGQLHALQAAEQIIPINTIHKTIGGMKAYASLTELTEELVADTAVVILSADKLPNIVREASKNAVKNIIIINDLEQATPHIRSKLDKASELAEKANIRLLAVTTSGMEGLFSRNPNASCAYIGQSAGIADCMLSYAKSRGMAFSRFITLNPQQNDTVSTGQVLDFIATEAGTDAVLVHISTLDNTRELLSALTAASRRKPVFVLNTLPEGEQENLFNQALERNKIFTVQTLSEFHGCPIAAHRRGGQWAAHWHYQQYATNQCLIAQSLATNGFGIGTRQRKHHAHLKQNFAAQIAVHQSTLCIRRHRAQRVSDCHRIVFARRPNGRRLPDLRRLKHHRKSAHRPNGRRIASKLPTQTAIYGMAGQRRQ